MRLAFAVCRKDASAATVAWARLLAHVGYGDKSIRMAVAAEVPDSFIEQLEEILPLDVIRCNVTDPGYPAGANMLFCLAMRGIKEPTLWIEPDSIPMWPGWLAAIEAEYREEGKPFLGPILKIWSTPHMNGTAVYPPNWEELSAGTITECPPHQPWDTNSRDAVVPHAAASKTIFHSYTPVSLKNGYVGQFDKYALVHPCKDASILVQTAAKHGLELEVPALEYYLIKGGLALKHGTRVKIGSSLWSLLKCETLSEIALAKRRDGCQLISEKDYYSLLEKRA